MYFTPNRKYYLYIGFTRDVDTHHHTYFSVLIPHLSHSTTCHQDTGKTRSSGCERATLQKVVNDATPQLLEAQIPFLPTTFAI